MDEALLLGLTLKQEDEPDNQKDAREKYMYRNENDNDWGSGMSDNDDEDEGHDNDTQGSDAENDLDSNRIGGQAGSSSSNKALKDSDSNPHTNRYPERESGAMTGPKGVLADQKYHRQQQDKDRATKLTEHNAKMLSKAATTTTYLQDLALAEQDGSKTADEKEKLRKLKENEQEEEEETLAKIRQNRLRDLQRAKKGNGDMSNKKVYGCLLEMNSSQYVAAIDEEAKDVAVVIHIYTETNPECRRLDDCLILLAARYATTKFIRIHAREVEFDVEVCPSVLVYRAGDLIASLIKITYDLSAEFDDLELEELLTKNKVITPHDRHDKEMSFFNGFFGGNGGDLEDDTFSAVRATIGSGSRRGILSSGTVRDLGFEAYEDDF